MASSNIRPNLLVADKDGNIFDHPDLLMVCRKGNELALPKPDELMPLPEGSDLFLLPGRLAIGLDPETGEAEALEEYAVAAFAAPAHTLTAHPAYMTQDDAPTLPLFAYGAVGFANGKFYVCAKKVDQDVRQIFAGISCNKIEKNAHQLMKRYPDNRLMQHIMGNCVLKYSCPAARNLALGRFEAPLPTSRTCNARCVGCISQQEEDSEICATPQSRLTFTPNAAEVAQIMTHHFGNVKDKPIYSFGQGCEGEPLTEAPLLEEAIRLFRSQGGKGTVNLNTNASMPDKIARLCEAGLSSIRVSLNSAREEVYNRYYRPKGFTFADVRQSIVEAKARGKWVSLNLLFFPGITDSEPEIEALTELVQETKVDFIQLRNLNIDPEMYMELLEGIEFGPSTGFSFYRKRIKKTCPWVEFGYFNPYVGD
ncbi:radical SAM protein [Desulfovibrio subterraneus]|jgi:pyruvate-formate lyase-activating enzyme|uniref:Radical SAM protein n=1 Tax=Desulfovibrio subterraneus TaxID=2718620 RepID=A0A7J0BKX8_9BACT|nr:radical SAM protein [Desulfovibrio subterraneus]WBF68345.1 radical SAM protein [Desulfovibrio subterraneus]GFM34299.1 radical SAM protein [Desulfovibrio subterraneus]